MNTDQSAGRWYCHSVNLSGSVKFLINSSGKVESQKKTASKDFGKQKYHFPSKLQGLGERMSKMMRSD